MDREQAPHLVDDLWNFLLKVKHPPIELQSQNGLV